MKSFKQLASRFNYFALIIIFAFGLFAIFGSGPRYVYRVSPSIQSATNNFFVAKISPICPKGCQAFSLQIENKTDKDIEIDWNKTLYISDGRTSGGFMFEGVVYRERNNPKTPDIVFTNSLFSKTIWPNNLVEFTSGRYSRWNHEDMPTGENGVYLTVKVGNQEIKEKLTIYITKVKVQE